MQLAFAIIIFLVFFVVPVVVYGCKCAAVGKEYALARWPHVAVYYAMIAAVEIGGRFGMRSPLSACVAVIAMPVVIIMLLGGPKKPEPRGFKVKLASQEPDVDER